MHENRMAIEDLLTRFGRYADQGDGERLALLFLPSGVLNVNARVAQGQEAIARMTRERTADASRRTRHIWSNLLIEVDDAGEVRTSAIQTTYDQQGETPAAARVSDLSDTFRRNAEGAWRFASRTVTRQINVGA